MTSANPGSNPGSAFFSSSYPYCSTDNQNTDEFPELFNLGLVLFSGLLLGPPEPRAEQRVALRRVDRETTAHLLSPYCRVHSFTKIERGLEQNQDSETPRGM
jgi:hypothetical protein